MEVDAGEEGKRPSGSNPIAVNIFSRTIPQQRTGQGSPKGSRRGKKTPVISMYPVTGCFSSIYKFGQDDFFRAAADGVASADPSHRIGGLEGFGYALCFSWWFR